MRINQNIAAMNSYRNLSVTNDQMGKSLEKLSSGFRINRAADDAAGLSISEGLRSQVGGLKQSVRNAQDGVSVVQTAEGSLTEVHSILQRVRDLTVQAKNIGSVGTDATKAITTEMNELAGALTDIANRTEFNGNKLLSGTPTAAEFVGDGTGTIEVLQTTADTSAAAAAAAPTDAALAATAADDALAVYTAQSAVADKTISFQVGSKDGDTLDVGLSDIKAVASAVTAAAAALTAEALDDPITNAYAGADTVLADIDTQIKDVSTARATLGASQNRLEHTINSLNVSVENLSASESRIRDTDMAQEMVQFTRNQILSQAGTAMLAQANQAPQSVLSLLR